MDRLNRSFGDGREVFAGVEILQRLQYDRHVCGVLLRGLCKTLPPPVAYLGQRFFGEGRFSAHGGLAQNVTLLAMA